jgi:hypothetical protein
LENQIRFEQHDLISGEAEYDLVLANLPYVATFELNGLEPELAWEPRLALGGEQVTVKARTGAAVTLLRPLRSAYAASSTFQSTRVEFTVSTSCTQAPGRNLRIVEAALSGQTVIQATINVHVPRIERTGGGHADMLAQKVPISELIQRLTTLQEPQ